MFPVISTALVDQGVIISFLGPENLPSTLLVSSAFASPNSQINFWMSSGAKG